MPCVCQCTSDRILGNLTVDCQNNGLIRIYEAKAAQKDGAACQENNCICDIPHCTNENQTDKDTRTQYWNSRCDGNRICTGYVTFINQYPCTQGTGFTDHERVIFSCEKETATSPPSTTQTSSTATSHIPSKDTSPWSTETTSTPTSTAHTSTGADGGLSTDATTDKYTSGGTTPTGGATIIPGYTSSSRPSTTRSLPSQSHTTGSVGTSTPSPPPSNTALFIGIGAGVGALVLIALIIIIIVVCRKRSAKKKAAEKELDYHLYEDPRHVDSIYEKRKHATKSNVKQYASFKDGMEENYVVPDIIPIDDYDTVTVPGENEMPLSTFGKVAASGDVYSVPNMDKKPPETGDVYSVPNKDKPTKTGDEYAVVDKKKKPENTNIYSVPNKENKNNNPETGDLYSVPNKDNKKKNLGPVYSNAEQINGGKPGSDVMNTTAELPSADGTDDIAFIENEIYE